MAEKIRIFVDGFDIMELDIKPIKLANTFLPPMLDTVYNKVANVVKAMREEAPEHLVYSASVRDLLIHTLASPRNCIVNSNVVCHGASVAVDSFDEESPAAKVVYYMEKGPAFDPYDFKRRYGHFPRIFKKKLGEVMKVLEQDRVGRAWGRHGWSLDFKLVAAALASYFHNFVEVLIAYARVPKIPNFDDWQLPSLVLKETRRPRDFVPPAKYKWDLMFPFIPWHEMKIYVKTDEAYGATYDIVLWNTDMKKIAEITDLKTKGDNLIRISIQGFMPQVGYVTVEPVDTSKRGMTIAGVDIFPPW